MIFACLQNANNIVKKASELESCFLPEESFPLENPVCLK